MTDEQRTPGPRREQGTFTVATYNVHRWLAPDRTEAPERAVRVIRELDADIVALQEVALLHDRGLGEEFANLDDYRHDEPTHTDALLAQATGMEVVPGPTMLRDNTSYGNCLLTRAPVLEVRRHDLSYDGREPRGVLDVDLSLNGGVLRVMATHFGLNPAERHNQATQLVSLLEQRPERDVILMGDFNQWFPWWGSLRPLTDWFESSPYHRTFPTCWPLLPLDRIWVHPFRRLMSIGPHRSRASRRASDHLPVKAVVQHRP